MHRSPVRFTKQRWIIAALCAVVLTACGTPPAAVLPTPDTATLTPILAVSELVVGENRVPIGVVKNRTPLNDPNLKIRLSFFFLGAGETATPASEVDAIYRGQGLPAGFYVGYARFDRAGPWMMEARMSLPDGTSQARRVRIEVLDQASTPAVGSRAIASTNLTVRDVPELTQLTSDIQPDPDLYQHTIADTLAAGRPFLVAFSTPGFCQTAMCGPNLRVVKDLKAKMQDSMDFIHVEVYPYPFSESFDQRRQVPQMAEWHLQTEPWTFLVDAQGIIQAKYEGGITYAELEPALAQLVAGQKIRSDRVQ